MRSLLGQSEVGGPPMARLAAIPPTSREVVEVMASLGGRADLSVLATASGQPADVVRAGSGTRPRGGCSGGRNRRPRRCAVPSRPDPRSHPGARLDAQRRSTHATHGRAAAGRRFRSCSPSPPSSTYRSSMRSPTLRSGLSWWRCCGAPPSRPRSWAGTARFTRCSRGRCGSTDAGDTATLIELHTARHATLYSLGRLDEADEDYRIIDRLGGSVLQRVDATCVQVRSLTARKLLSEAVELAVSALRRAGRQPSRTPARYRNCSRAISTICTGGWIDTDVADDLARPDITDPNLFAVTCLLNAAFPPAHWAGDAFSRAWLSLEAVRILARPRHCPWSALPRKLFHRRHHCAARRLFDCISGGPPNPDAGEARGYEPETSQARFVFARFSPWFEPLEVSAQHARLAHEALAKCGELATAGYAIHYSMTVQLDCAPTLDDFAAEVDAGLAFARRVGNEQLDQWFEDCRWLTTVLRGESSRRRIGCCGADRRIRRQPDGTVQHTSSPRGGRRHYW